MQAAYLLKKLKEMGVTLFTGVPDSQLKALCDTLYMEETMGKGHIVAANEGAAVGLAAGHYLATGRPAVVYMQNSGIGNAVNPVASLLDKRVYGIPAIFIVGWRGEPGVHDEPQHVFQGEITVPLLELLGITCFILEKESTQEQLDAWLQEGKRLNAAGKSFAIVVKKGALSAEVKADYPNSFSLAREEAIGILAGAAGQDDIFVSTTGKASRELFEIREAMGQGHEKDFLTVGSMGHASMIAMGIALEKPERTVWCIDGDGASIMHLGSMAVAAATGCGNLIHVVLNNQAHETVGGMPVDYQKADFTEIGKSLGFETCMRADGEAGLREAIEVLKEKPGTRLLEIMVALGAREDLGRPTTTPEQNKRAFMKFLSKRKAPFPAE